MFDAKKCPAYNKGRWYSFFIESDGTNFTMTSADLENVSFSGNYLKFPVGFHIVDSKLDVNTFPVSSATGIDFSLRQYADGAQGITLPARANIDWCYAYVFGYFD